MLDILFVLAPNTVLYNPLMYYPLGVLYLAAECRKQGYTVAIEDMRDWDKQRALNWIPPKTHITAFTATSGEADIVKMLSTRARSDRVIVGGAHATLSPEDFDGYFPTIVRGEGEQVIGQIIRGRSGVIQTDRITNLDALEYPAWGLLEYERCFSKTLFPGERYGEQEQRAATIIGSRGCPFSCSFCGNMLNRQVIYRSGANIAQELSILRDQYNIRHFRFEDDNITLNKVWLREVCDAIRPLDIMFKAHTRASLLTQADANMLRKAGCCEMGIGLETADPKILETMQKGITPKHASQAVEILRAAHIRSKVYLMTGLPGETWKSIELTKQWMAENKPDKWTLSRFAPYPGTQVYRHPELFKVTLNGHYDSEHLWNFAAEPAYVLKGVKRADMNKRYQYLYNWLKENINVS